MRGKADNHLQFPHQHKDHPRLCGEKLKKQVADLSERGITPAYAGKRAALANCHPCSQDHPRLCGEKRCGIQSERFC